MQLPPLAAMYLWTSATDMPNQIQAPLYAIVAATGLAMGLIPRPDHKWDRWLNRAILVSAALATWSSAYQWLLSEDAGTPIKIIASVWAIVVLVFAYWQIYRQQTENEAPLKATDEAE